MAYPSLKNEDPTLLKTTSKDDQTKNQSIKQANTILKLFETHSRVRMILIGKNTKV